MLLKVFIVAIIAVIGGAQQYEEYRNMERMKALACFTIIKDFQKNYKDFIQTNAKRSEVDIPALKNKLNSDLINKCWKLMTPDVAQHVLINGVIDKNHPLIQNLFGGDFQNYFDKNKSMGIGVEEKKRLEYIGQLMSMDMQVSMDFPEFYSTLNEEDYLFFWIAGMGAGLAAVAFDMFRRRSKVRWF